MDLRGQPVVEAAPVEPPEEPAPTEAEAAAQEAEAREFVETGENKGLPRGAIPFKTRNDARSTGVIKNFDLMQNYALDYYSGINNSTGFGPKGRRMKVKTVAPNVFVFKDIFERDINFRTEIIKEMGEKFGWKKQGYIPNPNYKPPTVA